MDVNTVTLVGTLEAAPEVRDANGKRIATLKVATIRRWGDKVFTDKHRVVCWGNFLADQAGKGAKGSRVRVTGRIGSRKWEHDGKVEWVNEINADSIEVEQSYPKAGEPGDGEQSRLGGDDAPF